MEYPKFMYKHKSKNLLIKNGDEELIALADGYDDEQSQQSRDDYDKALRKARGKLATETTTIVEIDNKIKKEAQRKADAKARKEIAKTKLAIAEKLKKNALEKEKKDALAK